ncbi:polysaccharide deacetylase family protein [Calothrix sp. PCC 6303]|uniref:polysaccharide deacetylase family protein n=1 Tax=Calothrix sp. PCC 6303 TaxID=1170562 RepID=UPI0002A046C9|nr:polysaccharide deacetylase family protein [Calothrix sp. PCC 6303]AFZ03827.1 polysaccharide deacetylase [Calothrix sp. PCC 6303]
MIFPTHLLIIFLLIFVAVSIYLFQKLAATSKYQIMGEYFNQVETNDSVVALTYDDGPNPEYTVKLINLLDNLGVKATFFAIGKEIQAHPQVIKQLVASGHEVGNHSYSHQKMIWKTPKFLLKEINKTDELLRELGVKNEILFRAPFGFKRLTLPYILKQQKKKNILWSLDPKDYQESDPEIIANRILENIKPGTIILLHDGGGDRTATINATRIVINRLQAEGYRFLTVSQLLQTQVSVTSQKMV